MADIRINSLPTTASASSSDDFLAIDGATNGTRKLNAFSPTFGGNLTVSGTATFNGSSVAFANSAAPAGPNIKFENIGGSTQLSETASSSFYYKAYSHNFLSLAGTSLMALSNAGNLTVSGTGTSSFGGKIQSSAATATGYNQLYDTTGITTGRGAFAITSTGAGLALGIEASVGGTSFTGSTAYASYFGTTTATPIHFITNAAISATLTSGGNLGIGTTDIQGKLHVRGSQADPLLRLGYEVAGQSYLDFLRTSVDAVPVIQSGYGVDGSFALAINPSGGNLLIGTTSDTGQKLQVKGGTRITDSASASNYITIGSGNDAPYGGNSVVAQTGTLVVGTVAAASLFLFTNGTTALTLDSSQNATFAGNINAGGASNDADIRLHLNAAGTTSAKYAALWRNASSNKIFHLRADGDLYTAAGATITGAIAIGNTVQTAVGVASTHKVTISIGGSTYYLLATNV